MGKEAYATQTAKAKKDEEVMNPDHTTEKLETSPAEDVFTTEY